MFNTSNLFLIYSLIILFFLGCDTLSLNKKKITAEDNGRVLIVPYKDDSTYDQIIDATIKSKCPLYEMERTSQSMDSVYQEIIK